MRLRSSLWLCLALSLSACRSSIGRAPGPEALSLASSARGTLIVMPRGGGSFNRSVVLVDLPSQREREVQLDHDPVNVGGVNAAGELVYAWDADAGVSLKNWGQYVLDQEMDHAPAGQRWRLRVIDVASGSESDRGGLDGFPKLLEPAPSGGHVIVAHDPEPGAAAGGPSIVQCIELATGKRRLVAHAVGTVLRCDWKPDARAFALTGSKGGELIDADRLAVLQRVSGGYGPFTPDGSAYASLRGERHVLVAADDGRVLLEDARLPWPYQRGSHARERAPADLIALCGPRLGLYLALPMQGMAVALHARGGYWIYEVPSIKVADLEAGTYATIRRGNEGAARPGYSPVRLELLQP